MNAQLSTGLACLAMFWITSPEQVRGQSLPLPLPRGATVSETAAKSPVGRPLKQAEGRRPSAIPGVVFPKGDAYRPTTNPAAFSALQVRPFQLDGRNNGSRGIDPRNPVAYPPRNAARFGDGVGLAGRVVVPQSQADQINRQGQAASFGGMGMGGRGYGSGRNPMSLGFFMGMPGGMGMGGAGNGFVMIGVR